MKQILIKQFQHEEQTKKMPDFFQSRKSVSYDENKKKAAVIVDPLKDLDKEFEDYAKGIDGDKGYDKTLESKMKTYLDGFVQKNKKKKEIIISLQSNEENEKLEQPEEELNEKAIVERFKEEIKEKDSTQIIQTINDRYPFLKIYKNPLLAKEKLACLKIALDSVEEAELREEGATDVLNHNVKKIKQDLVRNDEYNDLKQLMKIQKNKKEYLIKSMENIFSNVKSTEMAANFKLSRASIKFSQTQNEFNKTVQKEQNYKSEKNLFRNFVQEGINDAKNEFGNDLKSIEYLTKKKEELEGILQEREIYHDKLIEIRNYSSQILLMIDIFEELEEAFLVDKPNPKVASEVIGPRMGMSMFSIGNNAQDDDKSMDDAIETSKDALLKRILEFEQGHPEGVMTLVSKLQDKWIRMNIKYQSLTSYCEEKTVEMNNKSNHNQQDEGKVILLKGHGLFSPAVIPKNEILFTSLYSTIIYLVQKLLKLRYDSQRTFPHIFPDSADIEKYQSFMERRCTIGLAKKSNQRESTPTLILDQSPQIQRSVSKTAFPKTTLILHSQSLDEATEKELKENYQELIMEDAKILDIIQSVSEISEDESTEILNFIKQHKSISKFVNENDLRDTLLRYNAMTAHQDRNLRLLELTHEMYIVSLNAQQNGLKESIEVLQQLLDDFQSIKSKRINVVTLTKSAYTNIRPITLDGSKSARIEKVQQAKSSSSDAGTEKDESLQLNESNHEKDIDQVRVEIKNLAEFYRQKNKRSSSVSSSRSHLYSRDTQASSNKKSVLFSSGHKTPSVLSKSFSKFPPATNMMKNDQNKSQKDLFDDSDDMLDYARSQVIKRAADALIPEKVPTKKVGRFNLAVTLRDAWGGAFRKFKQDKSALTHLRSFSHHVAPFDIKALDGGKRDAYVPDKKLIEKIKSFSKEPDLFLRTASKVNVKERFNYSNDYNGISRSNTYDKINSISARNTPVQSPNHSPIHKKNSQKL